MTTKKQKGTLPRARRQKVPTLTICPSCGKAGKVLVLDSRYDETAKTTRRRRLCGYCEYRFWTIEGPEESWQTVDWKTVADEELLAEVARRMKEASTHD